MNGKIIKRIGAFTLSSVLTLAFAFGGSGALPVNAEETSSRTTGTLTVHKLSCPTGTDFSKNQLVDANGNVIDYDGHEIDYHNNDENNSATASAVKVQKLDNVSFTIKRTTDLDNNAVTDSVTNGVATTADNQSYTTTMVTANGGIAKFENLPFGTYEVTENSDDSIETPMNTFSVRIPMTITGAKGEDSEILYDVHVYPKNILKVGPAPKKDADLSQVNTTSDIVPWTITHEIPSDVSQAKTYVLSDKLDSRLSYIDQSAKVSVTNGTDTQTINCTPTYDTTTNNLVFTFINGSENLLKEYAGYTVKIEFNTKVTPTGDDPTIVIPNTPSVKYVDKHGADITFNPPVPAVICYGAIQLTKLGVDGTNETKLQGVTFKLLDADGNEVLGADGKVLTATTDANGYAEFTGLKCDMNNSTKYQLKETSGITGYAVPIDAQPVTLTCTKSTDINGNIVYQAVAKETIKNYKDNTHLPLTGDIGTTIFTFGGALLLAVGSIVFIVSKKRAA